MTVIYRYPLYHKYLAERLSWAWLFKIAAWTAIVILPFVFAYISHGLCFTVFLSQKVLI